MPINGNNILGVEFFCGFNDVSKSGRPASGCNTLGSFERIRVPFPAARIMTVVDIINPNINVLGQKIKLNKKNT